MAKNYTVKKQLDRALTAAESAAIAAALGLSSINQLDIHTQAGGALWVRGGGSVDVPAESLAIGDQVEQLKP